MSSRRYRRLDILQRSSSIFTPPPPRMLNPRFSYSSSSFPMIEDVELDTLRALNLLDSYHQPSYLCDGFDAIVDLIQIDQTPLFHHRTFPRRAEQKHHYMQTLCDRVADLEIGFDRLMRDRAMATTTLRKPQGSGEKKYTWTAEVGDRKYKLSTKVKKKGMEKNLKWTAKVKGDHGYGCRHHMYSSGESSSDSSDSEREGGDYKRKMRKKMCDKLKGKGKSNARIVEIKDHSSAGHDGGFFGRAKGLWKRADKNKGKRKELSPQDAAALIQMSFRSHLHRRTQALRALRDLAIARHKFKEIKAMFNNVSYRRRLSRDAEERQRFSEKIIVLLLTVDGIEGSDLMVRAARKFMVDELEAMLEIVDPQAPGKSLSMRRRTFDMPDGMNNKELAAGVAQVVQMLDQEPSTSENFETCL